MNWNSSQTRLDRAFTNSDSFDGVVDEPAMDHHGFSAVVYSVRKSGLWSRHTGAQDSHQEPSKAVLGLCSCVTTAVQHRWAHEALKCFLCSLASCAAVAAWHKQALKAIKCLLKFTCCIFHRGGEPKESLNYLASIRWKAVQQCLSLPPPQLGNSRNLTDQNRFAKWG